MSRDNLIFFIPLLLIAVSALAASIVGVPLEVSSTYFDTGWYTAIKSIGYQSPQSPAFFPGFPFLWKALHIGPAFMGAVNAVFWILGVWLLKQSKAIAVESLFFSMLVPVSLFFFIPYSESLFFVSVVLVILGLQRDDIRLTVLGIVVSALIRPTAAVIIPSLFIARLITTRAFIPSLKKGIIEGVAGLVGVAIVFSIQSIDTGEFLSFFEAQKEWGNGVTSPSWVLKTWGGHVITQLDGSALFIGIMCLFVLIRSAQQKATLNAVQLFGIAGITLTCLLVMFTRSGYVFSLNRFVYATAFFPLAIDGFRSLKIKKADWKWVVLTWVVYSVYLSSYLHIISFLTCSFTGGVIILSAFAMHQSGWKLKALSAGILLAISVYFVVEFYLKGNWIA